MRDDPADFYAHQYADGGYKMQGELVLNEPCFLWYRHFDR